MCWEMWDPVSKPIANNAPNSIPIIVLGTDT